jgi:hypothetical protein
MDSAVMIGEAGFELVEAGDADEAIAILESLRDISIVFTDIQMPGSMDRLKLAHAVSGRWPIKIVATSGLVDVGEKDLPRGRTAFCRNRTTRSKLPRCCSNSWGSAIRMSLRGARDRSARSHPGMTIMKAAATLYAMISGVIWSSMKAMRSRNCSFRFFNRCTISRSGAGD